MEKQDLNNIFTYHAPFRDQAARYEKIRASAKDFATLLLEKTPKSREQSLALTSLQQAVMWANASIAINEKE